MPTTPGITAIRCAKVSISDGDKNSTIHPSHVPMGLTGVSSYPAARYAIDCVVTKVSIA